MEYVDVLGNRIDPKDVSVNEDGDHTWASEEDILYRDLQEALNEYGRKPPPLPPSVGDN